ncbi:hypothetical protein [Natronococcus zhouii]|uniref:hypothetical protein n=2 Tax=Natrialbaceae TaxID=1644061 RepID=UPI00207C64CB|nr:hypothetical protein [Natronococcus sp. CG52]
MSVDINIVRCYHHISLVTRNLRRRWMQIINHRLILVERIREHIDKRLTVRPHVPKAHLQRSHPNSKVPVPFKPMMKPNPDVVSIIGPRVNLSVQLSRMSLPAILENHPSVRAARPELPATPTGTGLKLNSNQILIKIRVRAELLSLKRFPLDIPVEISLTAGQIQRLVDIRASTIEKTDKD